VGQKTHPRGLRLGIIETWDFKWYNEKEYARWLHEDLSIQKFVKERLSRAGISRVEVERVADKCKVTVHTARPGIVIGRRGVEAEKLQAELETLVAGRSVGIEVLEVKEPELDAQLVAEGIARQIERRANFKQAMKKSIVASMRAGAEGVKIAVSGRLGGHEMARSESSIEGRVPLHTLRANIDYGFEEANTTYGKIGVKAWIFKGEIIGKVPLPEMPSAKRSAQGGSDTPDRPRRPRRDADRFEDGERRPRRRGGRRRGGRGSRDGNSRRS
jgi:small subunit ribosomal protein S3